MEDTVVGSIRTTGMAYIGAAEGEAGGTLVARVDAVDGLAVRADCLELGGANEVTAAPRLG